MKPEILNLEEWLKQVNYSYDKDDLGKERQMFISERAFRDLKHRIKSAIQGCIQTIEFNLYNEGWDDQAVKQFIDETIKKWFPLGENKEVLE